MKLHRLDVTAFGPFAETVSIDFDHLSDAGLFLLSGATGAGKSSVLDAVCFALFGDVPGDRGAARRLRCDQAAAAVAPRVELEATLAGRRFRIVRAPAWERPKKRGTGLTTEQASVTLSERADGSWHLLTSRLDEAGHLVTGLLGMNLAQFTQVALLPQGRFQTFLRARSEERHQLLQRLFRTGRFEDVERWLKERRVALRRDCETHERTVAELVSRVSEAAGSPSPDDELLTWARQLRQDAVSRGEESSAAAQLAEDAETQARQRLDEAREQHQHRRRYDAARADLARLDARREQQAADRAALDRARRAAPLVPLARLVGAARTVHEQAATESLARSRAAAEILDLLFVDRETLDRVAQDAADAAAVVRSALPRAERLLALQSDLPHVRGQLKTATEAVAATREARVALPDRIAGLREAVAGARSARDEVPRVEQQLAALQERAAALAQASDLESRVAEAREEWLSSRERALALHDELLQLRQARLEGMAAELAGALAVGSSCPVCGSADHPSKATPAAGSPDADRERAAQRALDDAKADELARDLRVRDLETTLALLRQRGGSQPLADLEREQALLVTGLQTVRHEAGRLEATSAELADAEAHLAGLAEELLEAERGATALGARLAGLEDEVAMLGAEIAGLLGDTGQPDLASLLDLHLTRVEVAERATRALDELAVAGSALGDAQQALAAAAAEAGFDDVGSALAQTLDAEATAALERRVHDHERSLATVRAVLAEPASADRSELPDLQSLAEGHRAALTELSRSRGEAGRWAARRERLASLVSELEAALAAWTPVRERLDRVSHLASFVDGKAPDNRWQMRLSAYVLAFRLSQVVAAANERLSVMSDQRYTLEHTGRRGAGETRGGLSLLVRDDWSGESRDPATLSGGETFVVSLALALGLADVITQEAGGADLDTLFVDEGFGSLDADTLDDVMDVLDSLRDGGRVVGVVSHVAEMRDRIPAQLLVRKSRTGSTVALSR